MALWLLRPQPRVLVQPANPWQPPYDKVFAIVIRAGSEDEARHLAQPAAGNEGRGIYRRLGEHDEELAEDVWLDSSWTSCEELLPDGASEIVVVDRREA